MAYQRSSISALAERLHRAGKAEERAEKASMRAKQDGIRYRKMWRLGFSVVVAGGSGMHYSSKARADAAIDALLKEERNDEQRG